MNSSQPKTSKPLLTVKYSIAACSLGIVLLARTDKGICAVILSDTASDAISCLVEQFPLKTLEKECSEESERMIESIERFLSGRQMDLDLPLDVRASTFQHNVWSLLRTIPYGTTASYTELAKQLGQPTAARAVARACATNPVALVIPCHRIVRADGTPSGYRWGLERKERLLQMEVSNRLVSNCPKPTVLL